MLEAVRARGQSTPALDSRPELLAGVRRDWAAFWDLSNSRRDGGPIPITEIVAWLDLHEIEELQERLDFYGAIRTLDRTFLAKRAESPTE